MKPQTLVANIRLVTPTRGTTHHVAAIGTLKAGQAIRMEAYPVRFVVGELSVKGHFCQAESPLVMVQI